MNAVSPAAPHSVAPGGSFCSTGGSLPQPGSSFVRETLEHSILSRFAKAGETARRQMHASRGRSPMRMAKVLSLLAMVDLGRTRASSEDRRMYVGGSHRIRIRYDGCGRLSA